MKHDLETQVSSLEEQLQRSEELNMQYLRRIDMLEQQLLQARGAGPAPAEREAASSDGVAAPARVALSTSLAAAAAKLPMPPPPLAPLSSGGADASRPSRVSADQRGLYVPPEMADAAPDGDDDEFDIDRLIQEQRDQPLPSPVLGNRAPIALRVVARPSDECSQ